MLLVDFLNHFLQKMLKGILIPFQDGRQTYDLLLFSHTWVFCVNIQSLNPQFWSLFQHIEFHKGQNLNNYKEKNGHVPALISCNWPEVSVFLKQLLSRY